MDERQIVLTIAEDLPSNELEEIKNKIAEEYKYAITSVEIRHYDLSELNHEIEKTRKEIELLENKQYITGKVWEKLEELNDETRKR